MVRTRAARVALLLLAACLPAAPLQAASFSCANVTAPDEVAICTHCEIAQLDVKLATLYGVATKLVGMGRRGQIQDDQRAFLRLRAACLGDTSCLTTAYHTRIKQIETGLDDIYSRGPF
ncbi:lysozyme inhibitor LprI family protein [Xanthobacter sp. AM11]|uniref:lysozyme inhibitor LprI family protein n=1 Tax=Xanthobacter sp. AM11 TaxID=3380643 RepID=UPI0039BF0133